MVDPDIMRLRVRLLMLLDDFAADTVTKLFSLLVTISGFVFSSMVLLAVVAIVLEDTRDGRSNWLLFLLLLLSSADDSLESGGGDDDDDDSSLSSAEGGESVLASAEEEASSTASG